MSKASRGECRDGVIPMCGTSSAENFYFSTEMLHFDAYSYAVEKL